MNARLFAIASVASFGLIGALAVVHGQRVAPGRRIQQVTPNQPIPKEVPRAVMRQAAVGGGRRFVANGEGPPSWPVQVDFTLQLDPNTKALYQQMATTLSGYTAVPNDRLNYYSAVNNPPNSVINGWGGVVNGVQPVDGGGYLVTTFVYPSLSTSQYGAPTDISSDYSEHYAVDANSNVRYVGFLDPNGWAGQMPEYFMTP